MGKLEEIEKLQSLKDSGAITQAEFEVEKQKILSEQTSQERKKVTSKKPKTKLFFIIAGVFAIITVICTIITIQIDKKSDNLNHEMDVFWSEYLVTGNKSEYNKLEREAYDLEDTFDLFLYTSLGIGTITGITLIIGIVLKVKEKGGIKIVD